MARSHRRIRSSLCLVAVPLLIGLCEVLVAPGEVEASCGDYLMMPGHAMPGHAMFGHGGSATTIATAAGLIPVETLPVQLPQPCRGPHCDRSGAPWAPVPGFFLERIHVEAAFVDPVMGLTRNHNSGLLLRRQVHGLSGYPRLIERPPRQV